MQMPCISGASGGSPQKRLSSIAGTHVGGLRSVPRLGGAVFAHERPCAAKTHTDGSIRTRWLGGWLAGWHWTRTIRWSIADRAQESHVKAAQNVQKLTASPMVGSTIDRSSAVSRSMPSFAGEAFGDAQPDAADGEPSVTSHADDDDDQRVVWMVVASSLFSEYHRVCEQPVWQVSGACVCVCM